MILINNDDDKAENKREESTAKSSKTSVGIFEKRMWLETSVGISTECGYLKRMWSSPKQPCPGVCVCVCVLDP
jgi:hypothetical protein